MTPILAIGIFVWALVGTLLMMFSRPLFWTLIIATIAVVGLLA